jgi:hypothetical protein
MINLAGNTPKIFQLQVGYLIITCHAPLSVSEVQVEAVSELVLFYLT